MNNISIIIPYRDRREHLDILVPVLRGKFPDSEIIVVEQDNKDKFQKACLLNFGFTYSTGDLVIFHDVDYVPRAGNRYYDETSHVYLPVRYVKFVYNDFTEKSIETIPQGYRYFITGVDDNFFGGVLTFKRSAFQYINGACPLYVGWGCEDEDLRNRALYYGLTITRDMYNQFYALDHDDNGRPVTDPDFRDNMSRVRNYTDYLHTGLSTQEGTGDFVEPEHPLVDKWIKIQSFT